MSRGAVLRATLLIALLAALWFGRSATAPSAVAASPVAEASTVTSISHPEIGFGNPGHLAEHFQKHGREFGAISLAEYLHRAQALRDRPAVGPIREAVRQDGVVTRFDRSDGAFLAFDPDLTIRTYFKPNNGEAYFDRQLKRGQNLP